MPKKLHYNTVSPLLRDVERYPYNHTREELLQGLTNFSLADTEPDPNCLRSKAWPLIKLDFMEWSR